MGGRPSKGLKQHSYCTPKIQNPDKSEWLEYVEQPAKDGGAFCVEMQLPSGLADCSLPCRPNMDFKCGLDLVLPLVEQGILSMRQIA